MHSPLSSGRTGGVTSSNQLQRKENFVPTEARYTELALRHLVEDCVRQTLKAEKHKQYVTPAVLMSAIVEAEIQNLRVTLHRAQQAHNLVLLTTTVDEKGNIDQSLTVGVDLVIALATLLGASRNSFEYRAKSSNESVRAMLYGRRKHVVLVLEREAEAVLWGSLNRCIARPGDNHGDVAELRYRLGIYLQDQAQSSSDQVGDERCTT